MTRLWYDGRQSNVHSQAGEDGVLQAILERLPSTGDPSWCVDVGAWDGTHFSNTANLILNKGWSGVLIEADRERYEAMKQKMGGRPVDCIRAFVSVGSGSSLDDVLATTAAPREFGVLSIDIDGNDYHVWAGLRSYRPRVVVIEFNPSMGNHVHFIQPRIDGLMQGSSLLALRDLAVSLGYTLVATTDWNAFFVDAEFANRFPVEGLDLDDFRRKNPFETSLLQLYDGTVLLHGNTHLIWHQVPIQQAGFQPLPRRLRFFPGSRDRIRNGLQRLWLVMHRKGAT